MESIRNKMEELSQYFPKGVTYSIQNDTSQFVKVSIHEVVKTLFEGIFLVFIIMYLFLQNFRYTIIPTIVVPIALMGTFAVMNMLGFSINMLSMFGMVLSIGILIDDADCGGGKRGAYHGDRRLVATRRDPTRRWARSPAPLSVFPWF